MLLAEAIEEFMRFLQTQGRAVDTRHQYKMALDQLHRYLTTHDPESVEQIERVSFLTMVKFLEHCEAMAERPRASGTRAGLATRLRVFGDYLEQYAELDFCSKRNPFTRLPRPKVTYRMIHVPEIDDVVEVLKRPYFFKHTGGIGRATHSFDLSTPYRLWMNERNRLALFTFCITGIRAGEAAYLQWRSVTMRHLYILGKGNKERVVPIPEKLANMFQRFRQLELERGRGLVNQQVFWAHDHGNEKNPATPMTVNTFYLVVKKVFKDRVPGFALVGPHLLRHAALTALVESGVDIVTVASIAGHASIDTTYRHYVMPRDRRKADAINNSPMNQAFNWS